ncbi:hypothetical protein Syun_031840 [Stephania yunnanensis]|uniref:Uncharacterized protein n=1 Tax=Stephania yunnanensis TaxID=152371 RepID=A0AAP0DX10_9MAGN
MFSLGMPSASTVDIGMRSGVRINHHSLHGHPIHSLSLSSKSSSWLRSNQHSILISIEEHLTRSCSGAGNLGRGNLSVVLLSRREQAPFFPQGFEASEREEASKGSPSFASPEAGPSPLRLPIQTFMIPVTQPKPDLSSLASNEKKPA